MNAIFDEIIQLLLRSKVAKAESCLIGGYHDERIELTYYIETLDKTLESPSIPIPFQIREETMRCKLH